MGIPLPRTIECLTNDLDEGGATATFSSWGAGAEQPTLQQQQQIQPDDDNKE